MVARWRDRAEQALRRAPFWAVVAAAACSSSTTGSIGAVLGRDPDTGALHVREAPESLGAAEAGLLPGDRIKMIDGVHVDDLDAAEIRARLRGEVGSRVRLTVIRGEEVLRVEIVRSELREADRAAPREERIE